jgi:polyprenyl P-hydroxybenzoate/phenylacrylic acid decarboxylase-like protein
MELIVGMTGASGIVYCVNLLKFLRKQKDVVIHLIISENAKKLIEYETGLTLDDLKALANHYYNNSDLSAAVASGSKIFQYMIIVPCSMATLAKINTGITDNLIVRAADVCQKEGRKLIIVPRETPLNTTHLKNLMELSQKGVTVLPAMPAFYHKPESIQDQIDFITGKIMDNLGLTHELYRRWAGE